MRLPPSPQTPAAASHCRLVSCPVALCLVAASLAMMTPGCQTRGNLASCTPLPLLPPDPLPHAPAPLPPDAGCSITLPAGVIPSDPVFGGCVPGDGTLRPGSSCNLMCDAANGYQLQGNSTSMVVQGSYACDASGVLDTTGAPLCSE